MIKTPTGRAFWKYRDLKPIKPQQIMRPTIKLARQPTGTAVLLLGTGTPAYESCACA
jgi:hypothetical protein